MKYTFDEPDHDYFLGVAEAVRDGARCLKRKYGAVLVKDKRIISVGFNAPPGTVPTCEVCARADLPSGSNYDNCPSIHAEIECLVNAERDGITIHGATLYLAGEYPPCNLCRRVLSNAEVHIIRMKAGVV